MEVAILDLKKCTLSQDLAEDRPEWRNKIHIDYDYVDDDVEFFLVQKIPSFKFIFLFK